MVKKWSSSVLYAIAALWNMISDYEKEILSMLVDGKKMTISDIQRALKISYKEAHRHVKKLESMGSVICKKSIHEKHWPVYVEFNPKTIDKQFVETLKHLSKK